MGRKDKLRVMRNGSTVLVLVMGGSESKGAERVEELGWREALVLSNDLSKVASRARRASLMEGE